MSEPFVIAGASAVSKPVIEKSFGQILDWIGKPVSLLYHFKDNVQDLDEKVILLEEKKNTVEMSQRTAERRGERTVDELQKWQTDASTLVREAEVLKADEENAKKKCFFGLCLNPWSRYKFSKEAKKKSESIAQHVSKAVNEFRLPYSHVLDPVPETALPVKGYEDFSSRRGVLDQIMEELRGSTVNMIGLHGMAGAGKTTMIKEVKRKAEEDQLFDMVVFADVTNKPDVGKIQNDIARGIGMDLLPEGLDSRQVADRIKAKLLELMQTKKKVLVIFDDLWDRLELEEVGILFEEIFSSVGGSMKLKILMTSRNCDVLEIEMGTQKEFAIGQLRYEEAWQLFKKIVGDKAEHPELRPTGEEIVKECGGLPLAIATLANALKKGILHEWRAALTKVRSPSPHNFKGIYSKVYTAIEVSFSHLETKELQQTLLLCCMMGRGAFIQDLFMYGVGLGLFPQANTIQEAQDELFTLIGSLKAASLLIDGSYAGCFYMHDLIRDVAISIARRDRQGLLLMNEASQNLSDMELEEGFKWIIHAGSFADCSELFDWSKCSNLALLSIDGIVPENSFERMESLKVLKLTGMDMPSLPSSLCFLKNLHTLCLRRSRLGDMSLIGELKSLEILDLRGSSFKELPRETGEVTRLKSLDLRGCLYGFVIPPRVLESLTKLEELYLAYNFSWGDPKGDESRENSNLYELKHLKKLTTLHTPIADVTMIPEDLLSSNLKCYRIFIGSVYLDYSKCEYDDPYSHDSRMLKITSAMNIYQWNECPINPLLKTVTLLHLQNINGVKNLVDEINNEGFPDLKDLTVLTCPDLQHIANSRQGVLLKAFPNLEVMVLESLPKLEKIFHGRFEETSFSKLRKVQIFRCDELKVLFSSSIARQLVQLQELVVKSCSKVEVIVDDMEQAGGLDDIVEATEAANPMFGEQLRVLRLSELPKLVSLKSNCRSKPFFNDQVIFPNLEKLDLTEINANANALWQTTYFTSFSFVENLVDLRLSKCHNLEYLFPSEMVKSFVKLKNLKICSCDRMKKVIVTENEEDLENVIFPALEFLSIDNIPELVGFYIGICRVEFPYLKELRISDCPKMKGFAKTPTSADNGADIHTLFNEQVRFSKLKILRIDRMGSLIKICDDQPAGEIFCKLNELSVNFCGKLMHLFPIYILKKLHQLEISCCPSLEEICGNHPTLGHNEVKDEIVFRKLKHLQLCFLKRLKSFCSLTCKIHFPSLENATVENCDAMEQVILGEVSEAALFPKLETLKLQNLPKLTSFCSGKSIELFCLKELILWRCSSLKTFITSSNLGGMIEYSTKAAHTNTSALFDAKAGFPKLQKLTIGLTESFDKIWDDKLDADAFCKLNHLRVYACGKLLNIFPLSILDRLHQLEKLDIRGCYSLEEILGSDKQSATWSQDPMSSQSNLANDEVMNGIIFGKLKRLQLCSLGRLKTFCSLKCKVELSSLEKATVMGCPCMQHFCMGEPTTPKLENVRWTRDAKEGSWKGDFNTTIQEMFIKKVGYSSFEYLDLGSFPEFISIWNKKPQETLNFKILRRLYVCNIKSLSYLLTPSMALDLEQLCELKIMNCDAMEQVIAGEVSQGTLLFPNLWWLFPNLWWLWLEDLPKLSSFCLGNSIELFRLQHLWIHKCHLLTTFISSSYPGDDHIITSSEEAKDAYTPALFDAKATFSSLVKLKLEYGDVIIEMWRGENPGDHFPKLIDVELINFPEQSIELPTFFLQSLPKLKYLEVNGVSREISQKHGANLVIEDMRMSGRHYEVGECSGDRSANVLEESSSVTEEEKVNASEDGSNDHQYAKDEADESENKSNDLEERNGGR